MNEILYAIINNRVNLDELFPGNNVTRDAAFLAVDGDIRAAVTYVTNQITANGDDRTDVNVVSSHATDWLTANGLQPIGPGVLNNQAVHSYRLDGLHIQNYKGIGANFVPIGGLSAFDLILFRAVNGRGKSSITSALCEDRRNIPPVDRFNGGPPLQTHVSISLLPQLLNGVTPAFRQLGKDQQALVKPDLNAILSTNVNPGDWLATLSGQNRLINQQTVLTRLLSNFNYSLNAILVQIVNAPAPHNLQNHFTDWKRDVRAYRDRFVPANSILNRQLNWAYLTEGLQNLWEKLFSPVNQPFPVLDENDFNKTDRILQAIYNALVVPKAPQELLDAQSWLERISRDLDGNPAGNGKFAAYESALAGFSLQSAQVLTEVVNQCNKLCASPFPTNPVAAASFGDADQAYNALASRAGFRQGNIPDIDVIGVWLDQLITGIQGWKSTLDSELTTINIEIKLFDHRQTILKESAEWLESQENQTLCPTCDTHFDKSNLINIIKGLLQPDHPRQGEADNLKTLIEDCKAAITSLQDKLAHWKKAKLSKERTKSELIALFGQLSPPLGQASNTRLAEVDNFIASWSAAATRLTWDDDVLLQDSATHLVNLNQALQAVNIAIQNIPTVHPRSHDYKRLSLLTRIVQSEFAVNAFQWAPDWPDQALTRNAIVEHFRTAAQNLSTQMAALIAGVNAQLVNNANVQNTYNNFVAAGNHPFLNGQPMKGVQHNRLSEGYRVVHAVAAIFALAAAPNAPGNDADFIILDEPTKGLDSNLRFTLAQCIAINATKQVIVTTYDNDFADNLVAQYQAQGKPVTEYTLLWDQLSGTTHNP